MASPNRTRVYSDLEKSDKDIFQTYKVTLYSNGQGNCTCQDWWNRGAVAANLDYKCKHITRAETKYLDSIKPRSVSVVSIRNRKVEVFADAQDQLSLKVTDAFGAAALITEHEVADAFSAGRKALSDEKSDKMVRNSSSPRYPFWYGFDGAQVTKT